MAGNDMLNVVDALDFGAERDKIKFLGTRRVF